MVQKVIDNSKEIQLLDQDIEKAKKELAYAKTSYFPRLTLQGSLGVDLLSLDEFDAANNMGSDLIFDWNFFQNGMVIYRVTQAKAQLEITIMNRKKQEIDRIHDVRFRIYDLLEKKESVDLQMREFELAQKTLEKARTEFQQGRSRRTDLLKIETQMYEKKNNYEKSNRQYRLMYQKLKKDAALPLEEEFDIEKNPQVPDFLEAKGTCLEAAVGNRIETREAEIQFELSKKAVWVAKLGRFPQIDFFAGNAFALDDLENGTGEFQFRTGVIARYPLYDGGQIKLQIVMAEMACRKAEFQWQESKRKVQEEVEKTYDDWINVQASFESGKTQLDSMKAEMEQAEIEYKNGNISPFEWEEAQLNFERMENYYYGLKLGLLRAQADLAKALGFKTLEEIFKQESAPVQNMALVNKAHDEES